MLGKKLHRVVILLLVAVFLWGVFVLPAGAEVIRIRFSTGGESNVYRFVWDGEKLVRYSIPTHRTDWSQQTDYSFYKVIRYRIIRPEAPQVIPAPPANHEEPNSSGQNQNQQSDSTILSADEQKMLNLVNAERTSRGLNPLQVDPQLVKLARLKSQDMINKGYFSHQSPTYGSPFEMMRNYGVNYRMAGENLAGAPTVERAHDSLMNSSGHRANILRQQFTHVGIGIVNGGPYGKMFTQMFIQK